jgi:hypothetical protein
MDVKVQNEIMTSIDEIINKIDKEETPSLAIIALMNASGHIHDMYQRTRKKDIKDNSGATSD